jgi:3-methylcrotonyl-CoA carboxylase alpha subunit
MTYRIRIADRDIEAEIVARRPQLHVRIDGTVHKVAAVATAGHEIDLTVDGIRHRGWRYRVGNEVHVWLNGTTSRLRFEETLSRAGQTSGQQEVRADMPGIVVALHCEPGQSLRPGDKLLTMESMKLQVTLVASHESTVDRIHVAPDTTFDRGALLVSFSRTGNVET